MSAAERWFGAAENALDAAQKLKSENPRSSASRSYYSVFAAVTGALAQHGTKFPFGREAPNHEILPDLVREDLRLNDAAGKEIQKSIRILRMLRLDADYRMSVTFTEAEALQAMKLARSVVRSIVRER